MDPAAQAIIVEESRRKRRRMELSEDDEEDYDVDVEVIDISADLELPPLSKVEEQRLELYRKCWDNVQGEIETLGEEWNMKNNIQVERFMKNALGLLSGKEIVTPVAFIPSGLSSQENKEMFDNVTQKVRAFTPFLARLSSGRCSNVKLAFQTICKQLLASNTNVSMIHDSAYSIGDESLELDNNDETFTEEEEGIKSKKFRYLSIHDLQKWYESKVPKYFENPLLRNSPALGKRRAERSESGRSETTPLRTTTPPPPAHRRKPLSPVRNITVNEIIRDNDDDQLKTPSRALRSTPTTKSVNESTPKSILRSGRYSMKAGLDFSPMMTTPKSVKLVETPKTGNGFGRKSMSRLSILTPGRRFAAMTKVVAIVLENAEQFPSNVFPQLLRLLSSAKLPFVFIIGVNHCVNNFNRFIPSNCSTAFVYSTFKTVTANERLDNVFNKILNDDLVYALMGPGVVKYMSHYFKSQCSSVKRLLQAYQMCLMEHFRHPESILCNDPREKFNPEDVSQRIEKHKKFFNSFSKITPKELKACRHKIRNWSFVLRMITIIQGIRSQTPPQKLFTDFYIACSSGSYFENTEEGLSPFQLFLTDLRSLSKSDLKSLIIKLSHELGAEEVAPGEEGSYGFVHNKSNSYCLSSNVADFVGELDDLRYNRMEKLDELEAKAEKEKVAEQPEKIILKKRMTREGLKNALGAKIAKSHSTPFTEFRTLFVSWVDKLVTENLKPFSKLDPTALKIFVFDDVQCLRAIFNPDPLTSITNSLLHSHRLLNCKCCETLDQHSIDHTLSDSAIVFKLLKEQTHKKIDLNILFQSFSAIIENEGPPIKRKAKKSRDINEDAHILRFRHAVGELQFTGILKRNRNNPDEITKLVWL